MALIYEKCRDETEKLQYIKSFKTVQTLFATHFHEITEIVYLESGKIETTINGTTFTAEEGDAIFINRFDLHSYKSEAGNLTHVFIMGKALSEPFFRNIKGRFPSILKNKEANKEIFETVLKLIKFSGSDSLDTGICCLLLGLIEKFYPSVCTEEKKKHTWCVGSSILSINILKNLLPSPLFPLISGTVQIIFHPSSINILAYI